MYKILEKKALNPTVTKMIVDAPLAVSYTHLEVYKRQVQPQLAMRGGAAGTRQAGCTYRYMLSINNFHILGKGFLRKRRPSQRKVFCAAGGKVV